MEVCVNCGTETTTPFCPNCGQKIKIKRLSLKGVFGELLSNWIGFDNRFGRTLIDLALRPGVMINAYLKGNRIQYIGPLTFLLIMTAVLIISFDLFGLKVEDFLNENQNSFRELAGQEYSERQVQFQSKFTEFMARYFRYFSAIAIPFWAMALWAFYRKKHLNFVERLVIVIYMTCQSIWFTILMLGVFAATDTLYQFPFISLSILYYGFAFTRLFNEKNYFIGLLKALGSYLLAILIMFLILLVVGIIVGITLAVTKPELFQ